MRGDSADELPDRPSRSVVGPGGSASTSLPHRPALRTRPGSLWLLACLWPDNLPRFARLRAALEVARTTAERPRLVRGDVVDDLASVAATMTSGAPLVVFHSWVAAYLTEARQRELVDAVRALGDTRPVHYLYAEASFDTP